MDGLPQGVEAPEAKGQVGHAARHLGARQVVLDPLGGLDEVLAVVVVLLEARSDGQNVGIKDNVLARELHPGPHEEVVGALADADLFIVARGLALLVKGHDDHGGAKALDDLGLLNKVLLALLERDGVGDALALAALETRLEDVELGRVHHHGQAGHVGLRDGHVEELGHGGHAVEHAVVHVDVEHLGPRLGLVLRHVEGLVKLAVHDELLELGRAREVAPLPEVEEAKALEVDRDRLQARDAHLGQVYRGGLDARLDGGHLLGEGPNVLRGGAAAAAEHVDEAEVGKLAHLLGEFVGPLVVAAHGVGQAGVGVGVHVADGRGGGERLHKGEHLRGAQGAVEANAHRLGMHDGDEEGLGRLAGEGAARVVHDGAGDDGRQPGQVRVLVPKLVNGEERRLGVERVEDGLHQQQVHAALDERLHLLLVGRDHLVKGAVAEPRVLHGGRDGQRAVRGADGAGDEAGLVGLLGGDGLGRLHGELRRLEVDLVDQVLHAVVRLSDGGAREGVGLADVRTRGEVAMVDIADGVGLGDDEHVVVALDVAVVVLEPVTPEVRLRELVLLDGGAHGTVDDHNALGHGLVKVLVHLGSVHGDCARHHPRSRQPVSATTPPRPSARATYSPRGGPGGRRSRRAPRKQRASPRRPPALRGQLWP